MTSQELIYKRYSGLLYGVCIRYISNRDEAKDALQESFIKIFNSIAGFKHGGSFEGWIKRITINTCLNHIRYNKNEKYFEDVNDLKNFNIVDKSATDILDKMECEQLIKLIQDLPKSMMLAFNFMVIDGYSSKETGEILGIGEATVRANLSKGRKKLIENLNRLENNNDTRPNKKNIPVSNY